MITTIKVYVVLGVTDELFGMRSMELERRLPLIYVQTMIKLQILASFEHVIHKIVSVHHHNNCSQLIVTTRKIIPIPFWPKPEIIIMFMFDQTLSLRGKVATLRYGTQSPQMHRH